MSSKLNYSIATTASVTFEYKYQCEKCQNKFKNRILLAKHICVKQSLCVCSVCTEKFQDVAMLYIHKKSHVRKSNLVKNTVLPAIVPSPKKKLPGSLLSNPEHKSVLSNKTIMRKGIALRCNHCSKSCESREQLTIHSKTHQQFKCLTCATTFSSRFLLNSHVRMNCMKLKKSPTMNPTLQSGVIEKTPIKLKSVDKPHQSESTPVSLRFECGQCKKKFSQCTNLYIHQVQDHGLQAANKCQIFDKPKKKVYKSKTPYGGIPVNPRIRKAYADLTRKIASDWNSDAELNVTSNI